MSAIWGSSGGDQPAAPRGAPRGPPRAPPRGPPWGVGMGCRDVSAFNTVTRSGCYKQSAASARSGGRAMLTKTLHVIAGCVSIYLPEHGARDVRGIGVPGGEVRQKYVLYK